MHTTQEMQGEVKEGGLGETMKKVFKLSFEGQIEFLLGKHFQKHV